MKNSRITDMFGVKYPILQGAMAWIADSSLAAAVSNAGGLGIIAGGNAPVDIVREEIKKAKKLTDKPFGLNIMLLSPFADDIAKLACEEKLAFVTTGAGNPSKYMEMWKAAGIKVIPVVPSVALAIGMERIGADAVIAEGLEGGGHIGKLTTMVLIPQVVDAVSIPVIAAGGIGDGRGIAAAKMLGADCVQIGTRFLVAKECTVHINYKEKVLKATDIDTVETGRCTGHPVRVLRNPLSRMMMKMESEMDDKSAAVEFEKMGLGTLQLAARGGDVQNGSIMAGQIAGMVHKEQTAKEMIEEMVDEAYKLLNI
ncbi:MAG TPA: enoyl-[acyl-carrier-protein] reductase FabK [Clostridiales bacterium]|nr:enoyl-[acyl-carrier-protein] reductase FabK [Clostridiales bacterium]